MSKQRRLVVTFRSRVLVCLLALSIAPALSCTESQVPKPEPEAVSPDACSNAEPPGSTECAVPGKITLTGENFFPTIERALNDNAEFTCAEGFKITLFRQDADGDEIREPLRNIVYHDPQTLEATVPNGIPAGVYSVEVETPLGLFGEKENIFTINGDPTVDSFPSGDADSDADADNDPIDIPLTHSCPATETCASSCAGDYCGFGCLSETSCDYECYSAQCAILCEGEGRCNLKCGSSQCDMQCYGTGDCFLECDANRCTATHRSTGVLEVDCRSTECDVTCPSRSGSCMVRTDNTDWTPTTGCPTGWKKCTNDLFVCNSDCP